MSDTPRTDSAEFSAESKLEALEQDNKLMLSAILEFCEHQQWANEFWKNQEHIKPLFDIAKKALNKSGK